MTAITFDTLKFVERLTEAGVPVEQAKAEAEALSSAMGAMELATKADLREMEARIRGDMKEIKARMSGELKLVKWMLAIVVAATVLPALKALL